MLQNNVKILQIIVAKYCNTVAKCCKKVAKCCKMLQKCCYMLRACDLLKNVAKMLQNVAKCFNSRHTFWHLSGVSNATTPAQGLVLWRGSNSHTGEKPFVWKQCKYFSGSLNELKYHMLSHSGQKPFACNIVWQIFKFWIYSSILLYEYSFVSKTPVSL